MCVWGWGWELETGLVNKELPEEATSSNMAVKRRYSFFTMCKKRIKVQHQKYKKKEYKYTAYK